eukprot:5251741-Amphidinium_carterae.1
MSSSWLRVWDVVLLWKSNSAFLGTGITALLCRWHAEALTNVFLWFSMFLCLVSYIIAIYDSAHKIQEIDRRWLVAYASLGACLSALLSSMHGVFQDPIRIALISPSLVSKAFSQYPQGKHSQMLHCRIDLETTSEVVQEGIFY